MLIPNKFNGYQRDGRRVYPIGGGVGEAALLDMALKGAAVGGATSLVTGRDPIQGALLGGLTGGMFGGVGGAAAPTAEAASAAAPTAAGTGGTAAQIGTLPVPTDITKLVELPPEVSSMTVAPPAGTPAPSGGGDMFSGLKDWYGSLSKGQQLGVLGAGGVGAMMLGERMMAPKAPSGAYEGPLKKFRFDIAGYRPSMMADGGIASLRGADITVGGGMPRANPMGGADSGMLDWQQRSTPTTYMASGGISDLGSYSDGGRMLRGPGDGMSDNIPGVIGGKQPARLADGEFVVPADVVSHLGNGSTDAGAKQLYSMMDRVRKARTGTKKQGRQINPMRQMPA